MLLHNGEALRHLRLYSPDDAGAKSVHQLIDEGREDELEDRNEEELEAALGQAVDPNAKPTQPGEPAKEGAKVIETKVDPVTGEIVVVEEVEQTAEEKAAALAAEATKKKDAAQPAKQGEVTEEVLAKVDHEWAELVKKYPELAKVTPEGKGLRSLIEQQERLRSREAEIAERQRQADEHERARQQVLSDQKLKDTIDLQVGKLMVQKGFTEIPKDDKEWDRLWDENPRLANRMEKALEQSRQAVEGQLVDTRAAQVSQADHNAKEIEVSLGLIQKEAARAGLKVEEDDYVQFVRRVISTPALAKRVSEKRHGVDYFQPAGLYDLWRLENYDKIVEGVALAQSQAARRDTVSAMDKNKPAAVVLGAVPQGNQGRRERRIDSQNIDALEELPMDILEGMLK
jgi:hypothetical protein